MESLLVLPKVINVNAVGKRWKKSPPLTLFAGDVMQH
jgi:hypothetical protein